MDIKVLVVQLETISGNIEVNIRKVKKLLEESGNTSADLIIMPELWSIGWDCKNFDKFYENIENSKVFNFLQNLAIKYNSNIIGGSTILKKNNEGKRNTCLILNRKGNLISTYDKFHLFSLRGESEGLYLEEGQTPVIAKLDIGRVGISICYDIRFPELFRLYTFNNTDLIVNMAAWPLDYADEYITLAKARAIENQTFFITSCLTGKINDNFNFSGNSMVINYQGKIINKLNREEKVLTSFINLNEMKEYREQMPILKDTKKTYQILEK